MLQVARDWVALVVTSCVPLSGASALVVQGDPEQLQPQDSSRLYSPKGESISFDFDYAPSDLLPAPYDGVLFAAEDLIIDNIQNVVRSYDGNDLLLTFSANLTAKITILLDVNLNDGGMVATIPGSMTLRMANKLGHTTGTFPLSVDAMSFVYLENDLFNGEFDDPFLKLRASASPSSSGRTIIRDLGSGQYENDTRLNLSIEASMYSYTSNTYRAYFPDTHRPLRVKRKLTSKDGRKINAELRGKDEADVTVLVDGKAYSIPISSLSPADQKFIREWKT